MHKLVVVFGVLLCPCLAVTENPALAGKLENPAITEASGLARSQVSAGRFWVINDGGGGPLLYAIGSDGADHGTVRIDGAINHDWEDLASFVFEDRAMLLVADIGDNEAQRDNVTMYVVEEPPAADSLPQSIPIAWQFDVALPDGAMDAEAVAVDMHSETILLLSKRSVPAVLFSMPLRPNSDHQENRVTAKRLGAISSLPQPTQFEREQAPIKNFWHWQPAAMDMSSCGRQLVIQTYEALYIYKREAEQDWLDGLQYPVLVLPLQEIRDAEAASFTADESAILVTTEQRHSPLYRFSLEPGAAENLPGRTCGEQDCTQCEQFRTK